MENILVAYNQKISDLQKEKLGFERKQQYLPFLRLALFAAFSWLVYILVAEQSIVYFISAALCLGAFIAVSIYDFNLKKKIKQREVFIQINQAEVNALEGRYGQFDPGNEFIDEGHEYTHDLDIFGQGSIFQYLNRVSTIFGKQRLAEFLSNAFSFSDEILPRQKAVQELAAMPDLRQHLQFLFHNQQIANSDQDEIDQWLKSDSPIANRKLMQVLAYGLPAITLPWLALSIFGIMPFPSFLIMVQLMVVFYYAKQTMMVQRVITTKSKILDKISLGLELMENAGFETAYLNAIKSRLVSKDGNRPSKSIHSLSVILKYMDSNLNILVSIILNGLFMFNLHLLLKTERWKKENCDSVPNWFDVLASFDALCCLANFAYNHPDYTFPEPRSGDFFLEADNLGHPLILVENRVTNDLNVHGWNQFAIITGANMSGKSTFLRTIGVNYILAMASAPVCASRFSFLPMQLHSSIRTSDSLTRNESYFYAELKRLKQIIDGLKSGRKSLILLDEILKGTNSKDKQAGSIALIEQLLHYQSVGLFATHDLMLGELASRYPERVKNLCFEISIVGDQMLIDYKLHPGVCKNLNATYLMKTMGILMD